MNQSRSLFSNAQIGPMKTANRIVMAALTRARTGRSGAPNAINADYYSQRSEAAFIITEATGISRQGHGWPNAPAIYSSEQLQGWKKVTDAVHAKGGKIFMQLWHMGRTVHPDLLDGQLPVAPSAIAESGQAHTYSGKKPYVVPQALSPADIKQVIEDYRNAAKNALLAGFDGVELHAAASYLPAQFLHDESNQRTDNYGGSIENRVRCVIEVIEALTAVWGATRVGIKISPQMGLVDSNPLALFQALIIELNKVDLAYLQVMQRHFFDAEQPSIDHQILRKLFNGVYIANGGYDRESAEQVIVDDGADLVSFGRAFIANPDLPQRYLNNHPLANSDPDSWFVGNEIGYSSYPSYDNRAES
ncbi:MAG: alkene reductase [Pseudomonadales bacterium]|nr:alkene reductase [Pseudomonadales bacterium]NRA15071.1 alkene reductase [Oceanospirillaceae bacterium]